MNFLILDSYYPTFLENFYNLHPNGDAMSEMFGTSNFYSKALKKLGHQAKEIVINDEFSQKKWAKDHGFNLGRSLDALITKIPYVRGVIRPSWVYEILELQIKHYKPDVLYFQDLSYLSCEFVASLKGKVRLIVGQIACPLPEWKYFRPFDLIFSSLPNIVEYVRKNGVSAEFLKLAFDPGVLTSENKIDKFFDITHIGGYGPIHLERNELLERVVEEISLDFWGYGIGNLKVDSPILKQYHGQALGKQMYKILQGSRITLTKHISLVAGEYANNMTLYEATGSGAMLIADKKKNLGEIFRIGKEIETYETADELVDKSRFYLRNEGLRKKIANLGQQRTLRDHTWDKRMKDALSILKSYI